MDQQENEEYLDVLLDMELILKEAYDQDAQLTDGIVALTLDKSKIGIKQKYGYGNSQVIKFDNENQRILIDKIVEIGHDRIEKKVNGINLNTFCKCIDKLRRSVDRHRSYGIRGYYEFIQNYV